VRRSKNCNIPHVPGIYSSENVLYGPRTARTEPRYSFVTVGAVTNKMIQTAILRGCARQCGVR
jgi:hypothetical protein